MGSEMACLGRFVEKKNFPRTHKVDQTKVTMLGGNQGMKNRRETNELQLNKSCDGFT